MNKHIDEAGKNTRWPKGYKPPGSGRKPSMLKKYIKDNNVGILDVVAIFKNILFTYTDDDIKKMAMTGKDPETGEKLAAGIWGFCLAFIADSKRGWSSGGFISHMFDRSFGKTPTEIKTTSDSVSSLNPKDRKEYLDFLISKKIEELTNEKQVRTESGSTNESKGTV